MARSFSEFNNHEVLRVARPRGWIVDATASEGSRVLLIRDADRVEWGWYYYGRPEAPENWFEEHHWREGEAVRAATTATGTSLRSPPPLKSPRSSF